MKCAFKLVSLAIACFLAILWLGTLMDNRRDYIEVPRTAGYRDYVDGRRHTRIHFLLSSDRRGIVFDVFVRQVPPEKAPGPPSSDETQRWLRPRAERTAAAYARHFGFEKGIEHRHGQDLNGPLYFYGVDYYFAVPHLLLIFLFALPALWPLAARSEASNKCRGVTVFTLRGRFRLYLGVVSRRPRALSVGGERRPICLAHR